MASNATTGYEWVVEDVPKTLKLEKLTYHDYPSDMTDGKVGQGGYSQLIGKVLKKGTYHFYMTYKQPWKGGQIDSCYEVQIRSTKNKSLHISMKKISLKNKD